jgi:hypothetical protein
MASIEFFRSCALPLLQAGWNLHLRERDLYLWKTREGSIVTVPEIFHGLAKADFWVFGSVRVSFEFGIYAFFAD